MISPYSYHILLLVLLQVVGEAYADGISHGSDFGLLAAYRSLCRRVVDVRCNYFTRRFVKLYQRNLSEETL
jgi:hypothetical protein